jgi:hypothetical protein
LITGLFTLLYHLLDPTLRWSVAAQVSMITLLGRGFFPGDFQPGPLLSLVSVGEAWIGVMMEAIFLFSFIERFFV